MKKIRMKVVGVSFCNNPKRLKKIFRLYNKHKIVPLIRLMKEDGNKFDKFAIKVEAQIRFIKRVKGEKKVVIRWKGIGYVPKKVSELVRMAMDEGVIEKVKFHSIGRNMENGKIGLYVDLCLKEEIGR